MKLEELSRGIEAMGNESEGVYFSDRMGGDFGDKRSIPDRRGSKGRQIIGSKRVRIEGSNSRGKNLDKGVVWRKGSLFSPGNG
jgi:hypothetical protein